MINNFKWLLSGFLVDHGHEMLVNLLSAHLVITLLFYNCKNIVGLKNRKAGKFVPII